jgi:hypothetical protein
MLHPRDISVYSPQQKSQNHKNEQRATARSLCRGQRLHSINNVLVMAR